ncbi:MAG: UvrD-helicase domain-containing protein [Rhodospirillum sp.]|nr:UvrD-helicase domain-containing protein [Rhodospirillum sp.]MCF8488472.1 UvrD-helicase domain-containing protein [Rhodospirillum sp.]MCF8502376.1 UvrD-helicase domain-containing protein [Rhodospirillum sp.]
MDDPFSLDDEPLPPPAPTEPTWLTALNPEQKAAVTTTEGPVLVLSGAGTGKTRVLTTRLAQILATRPVRPWNVLAVTFTNKAAREMRERAGQMIGPAAEQVWLGTFHALGVRILRRHGELVGLKSGFTILDSDDQNRLLKQIMEAEGLDAKKWTPQATMGIIQRWKDRGLIPDAVGRDDLGRAFAGGRALDIYRLYQERLQILNVADFGDLLLHCLTIFQNHADVLADYSRMFHYILVDEYQDTNVAQYLWLRLLARGHGNICCVGDDDQSIYSWRGAEVGNILKFDQDFPGATIIRLESNYRSTPMILEAASGLIRNNTGRLGKELRAAAAEGPGDPIVVKGLWDGDEEARTVVDEIEARQRAGDPLNGIAILVRAGFQTREFEERLILTGTPYRIIGGARFYERQEIRDAVAYLRLIAQPDDGLAFERIINTPRRGLGNTSIQTLNMASRLERVSLMEAARRAIETDDLRPQARKSLRTFIEDISRWRSLADAMDPGELCGTVLDESGYMEMWRRDKSPEADGRVENLKELVAALEEFETLHAFLEHVSLVMDNEARANEDAVTMMTLHAAKGLEFDTVFLPGWEEETFPHRRALDESGAEGLEEERRLAYVGLTRARKRVFVSFVASRRVFNEWRSCLPSRFVDELPPGVVERESAGGVYGSGAQGYVNAPGGWGRMGGPGGGGPGLWADPRSGGKRTPNDGGTPWVVEERRSDASQRPGDRVFHDKFGHGTVVDVSDGRLEINFDKAGIKKVMAGFVRDTP